MAEKETKVTKKTSPKKTSTTKKTTTRVVKSETKKATKPVETKKVTKRVTKPKEEKMVDIEVVDKDIKEKLEKLDETPVVVTENTDNFSFSLFEVILLIIITILSCILVGYYVKPKNVQNNDVEISNKNVKRFLNEYQYILDNYYGDIDETKLIEDAIKGMLSSLDDYSDVISQESNSFTITLRGEYEGLGIVITNDTNGNIIIQSVYKDTPADKAGIIPGDIITKFNSESLKDVSTTKLVEMIAASDTMELTILRNGVEKAYKLKREKIVIQSVNSKMLDNKIGYIGVDIFASNTTEQFAKALSDLENQGMKSLIVDLRNNTGGHLSTVQEMLDLFLSNKHVLYQLEDKNGVEKVYAKGKEDKTYKIVILQNSVSASASEIMSASLKENLNAYVIGNNSFGKGTVQTLKDITDDFQYKVTTKRWLTPNGNWINGVGIKPDLEVNLSDSYYNNPVFENDDQVKAAIYYLK